MLAMLPLLACVVVVTVVKFAELKILVVVVDLDVSVISGHEPVKKYRVKLIAILYKIKFMQKQLKS
jgi:hypothetical protein